MAEAEKHLRTILKKQPDHADANHLLGIIACQHKQYEAGIRLIGHAIRSSPREAKYHLNLGIALQMSGNPTGAIQAYEHATRIQPGYAAAYSLLSSAYINTGDFHKALTASEMAINLNPGLAEAHNNKGVALKALGRSDEAINAYEIAIRLQPEYAEAYANYGIALQDKSRLTDALHACERAVRLTPDKAEAHNNLGTVLLGMQRVQDALAAFDRAIELKPDYSDAHNNRGITLGLLGKLTDATEAFDRAIDIRPDYAEAYNNRGNTLRDLGEPAEAEASYRRALEIEPEYAYAHSNLLFLLAANAQLPPEDMLRELREWDRIHGKPGRQHRLLTPPPEALTGRRLRVGYVSADLRAHVVSYFFEPLLAAHDRTRFEIFCYDANTRAPDDVTRRLQGASEHWRQVATLSDLALAECIRSDKIDILVDLAGHTSGNRLRAFTYRPATVQASYLGFFASTGLDTMDYWITDGVLHPPDTVEKAVEKILRLSRCWTCYQPPATAPDVAPCPSSGNDVVFGSFSNIAKLTPAALNTWARLLNRLPESRLLLMDKPLVDSKVRQLLLERLERHGLPRQRLLLREGAPAREYLATYAEVDIVLDPFPRTGGTTTAEALWMGVPVITLAGKRYVERISASKLSAVGLQDLVTDCIEDYIDVATALAKNPARRKALRHDLRGMVTDSPLRDAVGLAHAIQEAYMHMWEQRVAEKLP